MIFPHPIPHHEDLYELAISKLPEADQLPALLAVRHFVAALDPDVSYRDAALAFNAQAAVRKYDGNPDWRMWKTVADDLDDKAVIAEMEAGGA